MTNTSREQRRVNLKALLSPRHIAFIGGRHIERCIAMCKEAGFSGQDLGGQSQVRITRRYSLLSVD